MQANSDTFQSMLLKGTKSVGGFAITVEGTEIAFVSGVCTDEWLSLSAHMYKGRSSS